MRIAPQFKEYNLEEEEYSPLILGEAPLLLDCIELHRLCFPKSAEVFGEILQMHLQQHPNLEDWLIIRHYQFFWDQNYEALQKFEELFVELIGALGISSWKIWLQELVARTECLTTHSLCNRLYDVFLEVFGALYLTRQGWSVDFIQRGDDEKKPDIGGMRNGQGCVLECKFVHTSEKYESFAYRFNVAARKYAQPRPPMVLGEKCRYPSSLKIKDLSPRDCALVKSFNKKIYQDIKSPQVGTFKEDTFVYSCRLSPNKVPVAAQYEFAENRGEAFASEYLKRLLDEAALQLDKPKYFGHEKILFIGFQPDSLYLSPWNEPALSVAKSCFCELGMKQGIKVVFSEDADFCVRGYG